MNIIEILKLKFPNASFLNDIKISQKEDNELHIYEWNLPDPMPSQQDLDQWANDYDLEYRKNIVRNLRASLYPSWESQMDMQYWDLINNTTTWKDAIEAIKTANPLPTE